MANNNLAHLDVNLFVRWAEHLILVVSQDIGIASGATTPIFQGDLVTQLTAGVIGRHTATGTVPIVGVFNGVSYTDPTTGEQVFNTIILAAFLLRI